MAKPRNLSYAQRLALVVNKAQSTTEAPQFPYGFAAYARCAAKCRGRKLVHDWR